MKKLLLIPFLLSAFLSSGQIISSTTNDCEFKFILPNQVYGAGIAANLKTTRYVSFDQIHYKRIMVDNTPGSEKFQVFLTLGVETFGFSESIATSYYGISATALFNQIVAVIDASACGGGGGSPPTSQAGIQWLDEGVNLGTQGTVTSVDLVGSSITGTRVGNVLTITLSGAAAGWLLDGNTVGSEKWIGTIDNFDFPVRVNNVEKWRFETFGGLSYAGFGTGGSAATRRNLFIFPTVDGFTGATVSTADGTVAIGSAVLQNLESGILNIGIGNNALNAATTTRSNIAIGASALQFITTGVAAAGSNTAVGEDVLSAVGFNGVNNSGYGRGSLSGFTGASNANSGLGHLSGSTFVGGSGNVFLGNSSGLTPGGSTYSNSGYIMQNSYANQSNELVLGGISTTDIFLFGGKYADTVTATYHVQPRSIYGTGSAFVPGGMSNSPSDSKLYFDASSGTGNKRGGVIGFGAPYPGSSGAAKNTAIPVIEVYSNNTEDNFIGVLHKPVVNQGATFSYTGVEIDITTTAEGSGTHRLLNVQEDNTDVFTVHDNKTVLTASRFETVQGADVASAAGAIAVGNDGNAFELTGTNAVTLISNVGWQNGSEITFIFTSTATLTDGTANSGTDIGMELFGGLNFTGSADDVITLILSEVGGTQRWRQKGAASVN